MPTAQLADAGHVYRNYENTKRDTVRDFYRLHHANQTHDFAVAKRTEFLRFDHRTMTPWDALDYLNTLVDDSDPDTSLPQIDHLLQTAEAIRADKYPEWMVLTGFIHDLGKVLCLFGEPQWAVVGDTFPTGCPYSPKIVYSEFLKVNPDCQRKEFQNGTGVYEPHCGLSTVQMCWGHDEYLYHLVKEYLPERALYMIRYHSFYAWHREGEYEYLMDDTDRAMLPWVQRFNPYDLYSKSPERPRMAELKPYYEDLLARFLPATLRF